MRVIVALLASITSLALVAGCLSAEPEAIGPRVQFAIAPLNLPGIGVACYDLEVETASATVWSRGNPLLTLLGHDQSLPADAASAATTPNDATTLCSDAFGNGPGGAMTYVGPCDASADADTVPGGAVQNQVTLWLDGLYDAGKTAELGEWQDPCPNGCSLQVDCRENQDSLAEFNLTVMRDANQGFFDIAVNFEDIFCSAKFDTCDGAQPIELFHGADGGRDWTGVFGFACTAGTSATSTNLLYGEVTIDCGAAGRFVVDPMAGPGKASTTAGANTLNYGVYRGTEQLACGAGVGSCQKLFWNLAFSLDDLRALNATCTLSFSATANDDNEGFSLGLPSSPGSLYPYIDVLATLTTAAPGATSGVGLCQQHALNGPGGVVKTTYKGFVGGATQPPEMCSQYDGAVSLTGASTGCIGAPCDAGFWGPVCADPCAQGHCTGVVSCDRASGETVSCTGCEPAYQGTICDACAPDFVPSGALCVPADQCPDDPLKLAPGACGCGFIERSPCFPSETPIPGMLVWYSADAGVTTTALGRVSAWEDQSGNGNHATTANKDPEYVVGALNGLPVLRFAGASHLRVSFSPGASGLTFFIVATTAASFSGQRAMFTGRTPTSGSIRWALAMDPASSGGGQGYGWAGTASEIGLGSPVGITATTTYVMSYVRTVSNWSVFRNGVMQGALVPDTSYPVGAWQGCIGSECGNYYFRGDIAEIVVYNGALSESDRAQVETYLNEKYAVY